LSLRPRKSIAGLKDGVHGGINHAELKALGLDAASVLDFSVCTNPLMPPPGIKELLGVTPIERYPDSRAAGLVERLSERLGIPAANILPGNGTTELIRLVATTYFRNNDRVLILEPTYGEYEMAGRLAGARLLKHRTAESSNFAPDMKKVRDIIRRHRPRAVFICNPNNPTGKYLPRNDIEKVLEITGEGLLVLDEAYIDFVESTWNSLYLLRQGNVVVLRSLTKNYGLPGLRLGYAVAREEIVRDLRLALPPWNVNAVAQTVGAAVVEKDDYLRQSLRQVREASRYLGEGLAKLGLKVLPSDAHYFLVKVGNAAGFRRSLLAEGMLVRDCTSFGLPEYVRISPRTMPECERLVAVVRSLLSTDKEA
jgi:histidinol-phosphate aminotransferase